MTNQKVIGCWIIETPDDHTYFSDRFEGETMEKAEADARATFGEGCKVSTRIFNND